MASFLYSYHGYKTVIKKEIKERSKEIIAKIEQRRLLAITLLGVLEKNPILLSQYWKMND